ncbi:MAG: cytochrome C oxidase subunit IV family protein [Kiritimatiellae bacterium]|nr:cytochrome C oxidase subunit IV family protein [Kiritimatiellia bacterium]
MSPNHIVPVRVYLTVLVALIVLLAANVYVAAVDLGQFAQYRATMVFSIATVQALLLVLYFMHVRYNARVLWLCIMGGIAFIALMVSVTVLDYQAREWLPDPAGWNQPTDAR